MAQTVGRDNDVSGGFVDVGRRQYTLRFAGRYQPEQLRELVLEWREGRPIRLGDIARINIQLQDREGLSIQNGNPAIGIRIYREHGANVLETLQRVKAVAEKLRNGPLQEKQLTMALSLDRSVFIYRAIGLVVGSLLVGVMLSIAILWWFLRHFRKCVAHASEGIPRLQA